MAKTAAFLLLAATGGCGADGAATGPGAAASLTVSPSSATLSSIGATYGFSAEATNADGGSISGVTFAWSSSDTAVATVDTDGTATARDTGTTRIIATADGVADSATLTVDTTASGSGDVRLDVGGGANEPSGYSQIVEWDMGHEFPPEGSCDESLMSNWPGGSIQGAGRFLWSRDAGNYENIGLVEDPNAPVSGPDVQEFRWPAGFGFEKPGLPPDFYIWSGNVDPCATTVGELYSEVYVSLHWQVFSTKATGQDDGKLLHIHTPNHAVTINFSVPLENNDAWTEAEYKARVIWDDSEGSNTDVWRANTGPTTPINLGQWHHMEIQLITNTVQGDGSPNADGVMRIWHDGTLHMEHTDVIYDSGTNDNRKFGLAAIMQTFGAPDDADQGYLFDHLYISGEK